MQTVVFNAGTVEFHVARLLATEQHDVAVIDVDEDVLQTVQDKLEVLTVHGNGTSAATLQEAGIRDADLLVAVTAVDEVNLIACMMADRLEVPTTVARTRTDELERAHSVLEAKDFGIDLVIHPEESAATEITQLIERAGATDVLSFCDGKVQLLGLRLDPEADIVGKPLHEVAVANPGIEFRIKALVRGAHTRLPGGDEVLQAGDQLFVLTRPKYVKPVTRLFGKADVRMEKVMIVGGARVGTTNVEAHRLLTAARSEGGGTLGPGGSCCPYDATGWNGSPTSLAQTSDWLLRHDSVSPDTKTVMATASKNVDVVKRGYEAFNRGDIGAVVDLMHEDVRWQEMDGFLYPGTYKGPAAVRRNVFAKLGEEWDRWQATPERFIDGEDRVVVLGEYSGTYKKTGKDIQVPFAHVFKIEKGKVRQYRQYTDTAIVQQASVRGRQAVA